MTRPLLEEREKKTKVLTPLILLGSWPNKTDKKILEELCGFSLRLTQTNSNYFERGITAQAVAPIELC